jgi:hypothetical protein
MRSNKSRLAVEKVVERGLVLRGQSDAFPREISVGLLPRGELTERRMDRVRQLQGWGREFRLESFADQGRLCFRGVSPHAFPPGSYWLTLRIGDLRIKRTRTYFKLEEGKHKRVDVKVRKDPRKIILPDIEAVDTMIRKILEAPGSNVDGRSLAEWLYSKTPRPRRKACLLNILAKLRTIPTTADPLISEINAVFFVGLDRIYADVGKRLQGRIASLAKEQSKPFYYEGSPASKRHHDLLAINPPVPRKKKFDLHSYRHEKDPSLQVVIAAPGNRSGSHYADLDIDLGNPLRDLKGAVVHLGELIDPGETDHLKLYNKMAKGETGKFLNYKLEKT